MDNVQLRNDAISNGLCDKWAEKWSDNWTKQEQLDMLMSLDGMDFLARKHYPSVGVLLRHFDGMLEPAGLYVKRTKDITIKEFGIKTHFVSCLCDIYVPDYHVGFIYVSNGSRVRIYVGDNCDCRIVCYDEDSTVITTEIGRNSIAPIEYKSRE